MPSRNHIAADPEGIRDGGRHFDGDLASTIGQVRSRLLSSIAANEQPDAFDDDTGKAFLKVYGPAREDMLTLLESLEKAFQQAYDNIDSTAEKLLDVEDANLLGSQTLARNVNGIR